MKWKLDMKNVNQMKSGVHFNIRSLFILTVEWASEYWEWASEHQSKHQTVFLKIAFFAMSTEPLKRIFFAKQFMKLKITRTNFYMNKSHTFNKWLVIKDLFPNSFPIASGGGGWVPSINLLQLFRCFCRLVTYFISIDFVLHRYEYCFCCC